VSSFGLYQPRRRQMYRSPRQMYSLENQQLMASFALFGPVPASYSFPIPLTRDFACERWEDYE
jgi:hypothetical protein